MLNNVLNALREDRKDSVLRPSPHSPVHVLKGPLLLFKTHRDQQRLVLPAPDDVGSLYSELLFMCL